MKVKVEISGIDMTQDVGPLIKSFFPKQEVEILYKTEPIPLLNDINQLRNVSKLNDASTINNSLNVASNPNDISNSNGLNDISGLTQNSDIKDIRNDSVTGLEIDESIEIILDETRMSVCVNSEIECTESFDYIDEYDAHMTYEKRKRRAYKNQLLRILFRVLSEKTGRKLPWGILTGVRPTKLLFERLKNNTVGNISYMVNEYYVSPQKAGLAQKTAAKELQLLDRIDYENGYSLYVGFPFCPSICNYCSFGSHPIQKFGHLAEDYITALLKEIEQSSTLLKDRKLQTIYFGGGTPTAVTSEQLQRVIRKVKECFDLNYCIEFTVEAGRPDSIDEEKLDMLRSEGITRISINPQTMNQKTLDIIGRRHTVEQTVEAFKLARNKGFTNINMDLIAGLSGECFEDFKHTLDEVGKLDPDCLTVHTLALKRAAKLTIQKEDYEGLEASEVGKMVDFAADFCQEKGYMPYYLYRQKNMTESLENVGYSKPGKEGLYNILIMEEVQMILACGAGASSKFIYRNAENGRRFGRVENVKNVSEYISRIDEMISRKLEQDIIC